jgi:hypothetical protein
MLRWGLGLVSVPKSLTQGSSQPYGSTRELHQHSMVMGQALQPRRQHAFTWRSKFDAFWGLLNLMADE